MFSFCDIVKGATWYTDDTSIGDFYSFTCDSITSCLPLCIYEDNDGNESFYVGYFYDNIYKKWIFNYYFDSRFYYNKGLILPKTNIYWSDEEKSWENSDAYKKMEESFFCPRILYVDRNANFLHKYNELCFDDSIGKCEEHNDLFPIQTVSFKDNYVLKRKYSFVDDEYLPIISEAINYFKVKDGDIPDYNLLAEYDSNFTYNSNLTKENCEYLSDKMNSVESYISSIVTKENTLKIEPYLKCSDYESKNYNSEYE